MTDALANTLLYSALAGAGSLAGVGLVVRGEARVREFLPLVISFAAGTLLAVAFLDLLPEATRLSTGPIFPWVLASFIAFYFLENLLHYHSHHHVEHHHPMGLVAFLGMGFHSLIDGIIIGVGFEVSTTVGLVTTLGLLIHQIPQGIAVTSILLHAKYPTGRAALLATLVAFAIPVGALLTVFLTHDLPQASIGTLLAIASGTFLYVAASDLIPEAHAAKHALTGLLLVAGVGMVWGLLKVFGG